MFWAIFNISADFFRLAEVPGENTKLSLRETAVSGVVN